MDDDDEFGDLYTDVLRPFSAAPPSISVATSANPSPDLNLQSDDEDILYGAPDPKFTFHSKPSNQTLVLESVKVKEEMVVDEITAAIPNLIREEEKEEEVARVSVKLEETRVLDTKNVDEIRVSEEWEEKPRIGDSKDVDVVETRVSEDKGGSFLEEEVQGRLEIEDMDSEPMIPGLSTGPFRGFDEEDSMMRKTESGGGDGDVDGDEDGGGDDWDSDSEDDLQIVLNDKSGPIGMDGNGGMGSEDEDGENLVIVADGDQPHQPIDELEWGEDMGQAGDGERKEVGDSAKVNGGAVNSLSARIGYSGHGYLPHHHSQFKYVRPGAAVVPGGAIVGPGGAPGQVRPLVAMGPMAGRGRGDWRPIGAKPGLTMQRPFHSGFGLPVWANNSAGRGFGSGLDFTLPSHKTVFDIDIDSFEEKPWRHPGVDVSDFFNFGLDEDNWKDYCKQLEQLRLEATMQSKIRVYESGRSEQDYDPDLPPELAAAAGMHDTSAENVQLGKIDGGQADLMGQGRGAARVRPPIPTGRAIQVEGGFGERLPSIDTRPPRVRDCDSIIEIVLQGSMDDDDDDPVAGNDDAELPENDLLRDDLKKGGTGEDSGQTEYIDRSPQTYNGRKGEVVGKREPFIPNDLHEGDTVLPFPSEAPTKYNSDYKGRAPSYRGGSAPHERRRPRGSSRDRYPHPMADDDNDVIACQSVQEEQLLHSQREKSGESIDGEQNLDTSSLAAVEAATETSVEHTAIVQNELDLDDSSALVEGSEKAIDRTIPTTTVGDGSPVHSIKKQKLSSRVEPAVQDVGSGDDLKATRSSDNSKARSGSSRDNQKRRDAGEEEVVQEGRSRRLGDMKRRRDEDGHSFQRKEDYNRDGRQEMNRNRMFVKGREDAHLTYPYRERDLSSTHLSRAKPDIERSRERASSVGARLRRDDDTHGRRAKEEEIRKRECVEEMVPRHRSKVREIEKSEKDDHFHSRKRLENGDWRGHHDKEVGSRQRERDDVLMSRHENFDDSHTKRRKDEENQRREQSEKEILHGYRAREDTSRRKRERDDSLEQRRREDQARVREKPDDSHSVRHREENWRQREKDDLRLKQPHEDTLSTREREGRGTTSVVRSGRDSEDKSWVGSTRAKDEIKGLGSDKEYPFKDKRRQNEHSKRSDRAEDDSFSQRRGRDNVYTRENQFGYEDRNPRHERSITHNDRSQTASENQLMHKERHKDNRRNKESEGGDQDTLGSSKRKQEDHRSEKVNMKVASDQVSGRLPTSGATNARDPGQSRLSSSSAHSKKNPRETDALQQRHSSRKHREDAPPSDEENDSRRGRSKLERWTSHKDRDESMKNASASASASGLKVKETSRNNTDPCIVGSEQSNDPSMTVESDPAGEDRNVMKDVDGELTSGSKAAEVEDDRHLDTVAKLRKRSERFKTPMQLEKDGPTNKKMENEALASTQSETAADAEVKPERPARKRRWISSS